MAKLQGSALPAWLASALHEVEDDPAAVRAVGIDEATRLCADAPRGRRAGPALLHAEPLAGDPRHRREPRPRAGPLTASEDDVAAGAVIGRTSVRLDAGASRLGAALTAHRRLARPNVVLVVLDDLGFAQLGCFGSDLATPTIDRLGAEGLRFNRFHVTALCSPTRACLLTGRNHHAVGMGFLTDVPTGYPGLRRAHPARRRPRCRGCSATRGTARSRSASGTSRPRWEQSAAGPFARWPLGLGLRAPLRLPGGRHEPVGARARARQRLHRPPRSPGGRVPPHRGPGRPGDPPRPGPAPGAARRSRSSSTSRPGRRTRRTTRPREYDRPLPRPLRRRLGRVARPRRSPARSVVRRRAGRHHAARRGRRGSTRGATSPATSGASSPG